jgi:hypothetical protein
VFTAKQLGNGAGHVNNRRVVLEVDGSQLFSRNGKPSLPAYAAMAVAERDLRLYEVYRFGSNELVAESAGELIERFFDRLCPGTPPVRSGSRYRFAGDGVKQYAEKLREEIERRRLRFTPIDWDL